MTISPLRKAVFFDRDGVLVFDHGYVFRREQLDVLPTVPRALKRLREAGFVLVIATNQSGIGRGYYEEADMHAFNEAMASEIVAQGGCPFDAIYYCPHHPSAVDPGARHCRCRKPLPGMLLDAIDDLRLDGAASFFIGDKPSDVEAGLAAGVRVIQVASDEHQLDPRAEYVAKNLGDATDYILSL